MGFTVVQWENENSVSGTNGEQVVGAVELKGGSKLHISTGRVQGSNGHLKSYDFESFWWV